MRGIDIGAEKNIFHKNILEVDVYLGMVYCPYVF